MPPDFTEFEVGKRFPYKVSPDSGQLEYADGWLLVFAMGRLTGREISDWGARPIRFWLLAGRHVVSVVSRSAGGGMQSLPGRQDG